MKNLLEYDGLIYSIINKYSNRYDLEDLYQVSMVGLIDALNHYKDGYGTKFSSFAYYYIVGEINKYIRQNSGLKIGKGFIQLKSRIIKAKDIMMQKLGREPTNLEISLFLEVDESLVEDAILATSDVDSLDDSYEKYKSYDDISMNPDILDLHLGLEKLSEDERKLIIARDYKDLTQSEVSSVLGMSQVQVSRKEAKILQKLRENL